MPSDMLCSASVAGGLGSCISSISCSPCALEWGGDEGSSRCSPIWSSFGASAGSSWDGVRAAGAKKSRMSGILGTLVNIGQLDCIVAICVSAFCVVILVAARGSAGLHGSSVKSSWASCSTMKNRLSIWRPKNVQELWTDLDYIWTVQWDGMDT